jgi:diacylglycerol O-acyltransferase
MSKPIPPLDLLWLLIESPASTTHVGAMSYEAMLACRGRRADALAAWRPSPEARRRLAH